MPLELNRKDRKLFLAAGLVFVLLVIGALLFGSGEQGQAEYPSSYSTASGGSKAAYLLLAETGYKVQRWERPLSDLPSSTEKTIILAEPGEAPTQQERERLKAFVSEGGHLIATGVFAGTFLPQNDSVPSILSEMAWQKTPALSPSGITRAAPQIVLAPRAYWPTASTAYPLYGNGDQAVVVKYAFGRGEVLWWASATPMTNAGMKEPGNLEFFLACLGDQKREVLWDEYVHGYRESLGSSVFHSPMKWLFAQCILLGLAVVATFSRRSGPICMPTSEVRLSPIEFVQTLGGLYERAGSAAVAVDICYRRFRYWLTRRLGVAGNTPDERIAFLVQDRWGFASDDFVATMKRCEAASLDPYLQPPVALHLVQELDRYAAQLNLFAGTRKERDR